MAGRPSERWGQEVVAVVQLAEGAEADQASIVDEASAHIARYKLPKEVVFVDAIQRSPSGKADYRWAAETAAAAARGGLATVPAGPEPESGSGPTIATARLVLRPFTDMDRTPFFELNIHPMVVGSLGSSPSRDESDAVVDAFLAEMAREGWGLWAVEVAGAAAFVGMVGLHRVSPALPCAPAVEVGWRLHPEHWGHGYATEAAASALAYGSRPDWRRSWPSPRPSTPARRR